MERETNAAGDPEDIDLPEIPAYPDYTFFIQEVLQDGRLKLIAPERPPAGRARAHSVFSMDQFPLLMAPEAPAEQPVSVTVTAQELTAPGPFFTASHLQRQPQGLFFGLSTPLPPPCGRNLDTDFGGLAYTPHQTPGGGVPVNRTMHPPSNPRQDKQ